MPHNVEELDGSVRPRAEPDGCPWSVAGVSLRRVDGSPDRAELVALAARLLHGEYDAEAAQDDDLRRLAEAVPHPRVSDLLFWDERDLTAEQVVDEALAYRPLAL